MREIGSEFWDVPIAKKTNSLFPESTQWFLSGRSALRAIIKELKDCHSVAMPSWCCDSMIKPFVDAGITVHFYPVYWQDGLVQEISENDDVLFVLDYFGYTGPQRNFSSYKGIVIRDVTHSVFSATYDDADYYFGSLRKWCGLRTGGFAWTKDKHILDSGSTDDSGYAVLREKAMELKRNYINGGGATDKSYLKIFKQAEDILENMGIVSSTDSDIQRAKHIDIKTIYMQRRENAEVLMEAFSEWLLFSNLNNFDTPMFIPVLVPDNRRDELRHYLINQQIYCPVHWPISEYHQFDKRTEYIYNNELSLVCDQRYTKNDMQRIVKEIRAFLEA